MKILIAIDASAHSEHALEFVTRMRWPGGSRVIVASALPVTAAVLAGMDPGGAISAAPLEEARREVESLVEKAADTLREAGFPTEHHVLAGDPRESVVDLAVRERVDLIVVGSRGRTGLARLMLGSVSSHVVTHAPCSVLVVKHPARGGGGAS